MCDFQDFKKPAVRYWERRRFFYNLALILPAVFGFAEGTAAAARHGLIRGFGTEVVVLLFALWALAANIYYTFGYALEFLFGSDSPESRWIRFGRKIAFISGTLFAMILAFFGGSAVAFMVCKF